MAIVDKQPTYGQLIHAKSPHLTHCSNCDAVYKKSKNWVRGYYDNGTSNNFNVTSQVDENRCPICNKQQETK